MKFSQILENHKVASQNQLQHLTKTWKKISDKIFADASHKHFPANKFFLGWSLYPVNVFFNKYIFSLFQRRRLPTHRRCASRRRLLDEFIANRRLIQVVRKLGGHHGGGCCCRCTPILAIGEHTPTHVTHTQSLTHSNTHSYTHPDTLTLSWTDMYTKTPT